MENNGKGPNRKKQKNPAPQDVYVFDPTDPAVLTSHGMDDYPNDEMFSFLTGTRHVAPRDLLPYQEPMGAGSLCLPATIPLINVERDKPLRRVPIYGMDLVLQSIHRVTHTMAIGLTGAGKNALVIDPMRFSAIEDPPQIVGIFSVKASDYGPVKTAAEEAGKSFYVLNFDNAYRSVSWNALATEDPDSANDRIRRLADAVRNPKSSDSEFWTQWVKTALYGAWLGGIRSFPDLVRFFYQPVAKLVEALHRHGNEFSRSLAEFMVTGAQNADSVLASIRGALSSFMGDSVQRVMSGNGLSLNKAFNRPIVIFVEIPESRLETYRVLIQMFTRAVIDALIDHAEKLGSLAPPATIFFDDFPSLGNLMSVERLLTLRSRNIGIVAGVQSLAALQLSYEPREAAALLEGFANKIVLPGCPQPDAEYFAHASGEQTVMMPTLQGQNVSFAKRPLFSSATIRSPEYEHFLLGKPATMFFNGLTFQAYLQRAFEIPKFARIYRAAKSITGREKLRKRKLPLGKKNPDQPNDEN